jgi:hypothetical protein
VDVTSLKLWRAGSAGSRPFRDGYTHWTTDINKDRSGEFLFVCWKVKQVDYSSTVLTQSCSKVSLSRSREQVIHSSFQYKVKIANDIQNKIK